MLVRGRAEVKHVRVRFSCSEAGSAGFIGACVGTRRNGHMIQLSRRGRKAFTVRAVDKAGNRTSKTVHYRVKKRHRRKK